jgi:S-adenosylmethionine:tRNA ribosyltransferase-isomerase
MKDHVDIDEFTYDLPPERIAIHPLHERDHSRLLVYRHGEITHKTFVDIADELPGNAFLFFNNTKVIQARLHFIKDSGATIEIFLLHPVTPSSLLLTTMQSTDACEWQCTIGNLKRWKDDVVLTKRQNGLHLSASLVDREQGLVRFEWNTGQSFAEVIDAFGATPLPPYLKRNPVDEDKKRYQTIYSEQEGAVAAPTAGLHFTERVFSLLKKRGIAHDFVTLHVSAGTFQPVKVKNAIEHKMHTEQVVITRTNIETLLQNPNVIPVGTTSMRTLETIYWFGVKLQSNPSGEFQITQQDAYTLPQDISVEIALQRVLAFFDWKKTDVITGETSIYIFPGYRFRICKGLITNFHQPGSTLILLVAALVGPDWRRIYSEALKNDYRFLSYGDSSLLLP